ncbi:hypothetical protein NP233_g6646 [Leucocoprinus birnbaumii]|uniref:JmjC domain-containing protein n=1 Tax=Leucocoprinus birnbaumii TaxID=56174 RepID=A0AAD5VQT4_9AGAR|nr:hypothetical protein NP233_g6646 [Leucocoprinus birnbaumii]
MESIQQTTLPRPWHCDVASLRAFNFKTNLLFKGQPLASFEKSFDPEVWAIVQPVFADLDTFGLEGRSKLPAFNRLFADVDATLGSGTHSISNATRAFFGFILADTVYWLYGKDAGPPPAPPMHIGHILSEELNSNTKAKFSFKAWLGALDHNIVSLIENADKTVFDNNTAMKMAGKLGAKADATPSDIYMCLRSIISQTTKCHMRSNFASVVFFLQYIFTNGVGYITHVKSVITRNLKLNELPASFTYEAHGAFGTGAAISSLMWLLPRPLTNVIPLFDYVKAKILITPSTHEKVVDLEKMLWRAAFSVVFDGISFREAHDNALLQLKLSLKLINDLDPMFKTVSISLPMKYAFPGGAPMCEPEEEEEESEDDEVNMSVVKSSMQAGTPLHPTQQMMHATSNDFPANLAAAYNSLNPPPSYQESADSSVLQTPFPAVAPSAVPTPSPADAPTSEPTPSPADAQTTVPTLSPANAPPTLPMPAEDNDVGMTDGSPEGILPQPISSQLQPTQPNTNIQPSTKRKVAEAALMGESESRYPKRQKANVATPVQPALQTSKHSAHPQSQRRPGMPSKADSNIISDLVHTQYSSMIKAYKCTDASSGIIGSSRRTVRPIMIIKNNDLVIWNHCNSELYQWTPRAHCDPYLTRIDLIVMYCMKEAINQPTWYEAVKQTRIICILPGEQHTPTATRSSYAAGHNLVYLPKQARKEGPKFDLAYLHEISGYRRDQTFCIYDFAYPPDDPRNVLWASLQLVAQCGALQNGQRIVHALSIPNLGHPHSSGTNPADSSYVSWAPTNGLPYLSRDATYPFVKLEWRLAGTAGSFSEGHLDPNGFGTRVRINAGIKLWIILEIDGWMDGADFSIPAKLYSAEGFDYSKAQLKPVLLTPGSYFYMQPCVFHAAITLEDCVVAGKHEHFEDDFSGHCIDLCTHDGILDTLHLCVLLFFGAAIYPAYYAPEQGGFQATNRDDLMAARGMALTVIDWLDMNADVMTGSFPSNIKSVFFLLFIHVYYRIVAYLDMPTTIPITPEITRAAFSEAVEQLFSRYDELGAAHLGYMQTWSDPIGRPGTNFNWPCRPLHFSLKPESEWQLIQHIQPGVGPVEWFGASEAGLESVYHPSDHESGSSESESGLSESESGLSESESGSSESESGSDPEFDEETKSNHEPGLSEGESGLSDPELDSETRSDDEPKPNLASDNESELSELDSDAAPEHMSGGDTNAESSMAVAHTQAQEIENGEDASIEPPTDKQAQIFKDTSSLATDNEHEKPEMGSIQGKSRGGRGRGGRGRGGRGRGGKGKGRGKAT